MLSPVRRDPRSTALRVAFTGAVLFLLMLRTGAAPSLDLDPTWTEVLGWAHAHALKAGVDYVFTYGPLGFLYPLAGYAPGSAKVFLNAQIVLALGEALVVALALRHKPLWNGICCVAVFMLWLPWIAGDLQWYATFAFAFAVMTRLDDLSRSVRALVLTCVPALLAAIALMKFTSTVVFIFWLFAVVALYLLEKKRALAIPLVASAVVAYLLLWHCAGQPLSTWPAYMQASFEVASGYSGAMGQSDDSISMLGAIATFAICAALVAFLLLRDRANVAGRVGVVFLTGLLALVWRAGATRYGHWPIFFGFASLLPFCAICLRRTASAQVESAVAGFALLASLFFLAALHASPGFLVSEAKAALSSNIRALLHRKSFVIQRKDEWLAFEKSVDLPRIRAAVGEDTVDLLMTDQGLVLAMGLNYDPRPVFQSYSAYTPELARRNEAHFAGAKAPKFVILKMQPIDGRLPMQEDGLALSMLLRRYRPRLFEAGYLLLERSPGAASADQLMSAPASYEVGQLGRDIDVATADRRVVLYAEVRPTLSGRLRALTLREPALAIDVTMRNGNMKQFRLIRATARSGFLLSPLLTSAGDWLTLNSTNHDSEIVRFRIAALDSADRGAFDQEFRYAVVPMSEPIAMTDLGAFIAAPIHPFFSDPAHDQSRAFDELDENGETVLGMHAPAWIEFALAPGSFFATGIAGIRTASLTAPGCNGAAVDGVDVSLTVTEDGQSPRQVWEQQIDPLHNASDRGGKVFLTPQFSVAQHALARFRIDQRADNTCDWSYLGKLRFNRVGG